MKRSDKGTSGGRSLAGVKNARKLVGISAAKTVSGSKPSEMQYSKRLATFVSVCWLIFRLGAMAVIAMRPDTAMAIVQLQNGADSVMMVNLGFYAGNSVAEKGILGYFGAKMKETATLAKITANHNGEDTDDDDEG